MGYESKQVKQFFASAEELLKTSKTMQDIFMMSTSLHKGEKALTWLNEKGRPTSIKYKQYRSQCFEYGSRLSELLKGIATDSVVCLKVRNCPDWPLIFWGLIIAGYVPFLIDAKLPKENTEILLKQSHAAVIVTQEILTYSVQTISVNALKETKVNMRFAARWANKVIFCSSGTTGNVKLMVYNGANLSNQIAAAIDMPNETNDIMYPGEVNIIAIIPFHHIFGFVAVFLWYTFFGKNIVFVKDLSPTEVFSVSQKCGVTHVYSVPLFWDSMAQAIVRKAELEGERKVDLLNKMVAYHTNKIRQDQAGVAGTNVALLTVQNQLLGHKIRYCISGGGYLSADTLNTINGIGYNLYNGYGMTEAGVTSVELSDDVEIRLKGSIGRPLHGVEYKLINTSKLEPNVGELLIKSPITHCYEIIDGERRVPEFEDGFMHTGDIASVDETGRYYLKGRIKDIIINENGENIYPDEIEDYFKGIPGVTKICVVGVKKGKNQHEEITCVFEISSEVSEDDMLEIKKKCDEINSTLSNEKRVQSFLVAKHSMPLTASMKVKRFKVKELLESNPGSFVKVGEKKEKPTLTGYKPEDLEPVLKKVRSVFAKILLLPYVRVGDADHWINDLGGDSMSYIELITTLNSEFGVEIPEDKYALLVCVNDFTEEILSLKGIQKSK